MSYIYCVGRLLSIIEAVKNASYFGD